MQKLAIPFNVTLLELTMDKLKGLKPVRSLDIFDGNTNNFHEDGLFSTSIFGRVGDELRDLRFSYIDIGVEIFHPIIFKSLEKLRGLYGDIIAGKEYATWNEATRDFDKATALTGSTGFHFFVQHWKEINFQRNKSDIRNQMISLIEKFKDRAMTNKVVVIPAGIRDLEVSSAGRSEEHEINKPYRKLLAISGVVSESAIRNNPEILNTSRYSLQATFNEIYDMLEAMINGKHKLILGKWATRRVFNTTRNVASSMDTTVSKLGDPSNVRFNSTVVGLYQGMKTYMPITISLIRNGFLSHVFVSKDLPVNLVNKRTLQSEPVKLGLEVFDKWSSESGIEDLINVFSNEEIRHTPIEIEGHYLGLIYKGKDKTFKIIQDIKDVPTDRDAADVSPMTLCEFLYCSIYSKLHEYPVYITRYPITGIGSIYPSLMHLKTTNQSEVRTELGADWEPIGDSDHVAHEFPTATAFINTLSPHPSKLKGLNADQIRSL